MNLTQNVNGYLKGLREKVGNMKVILVTSSVLVINDKEEVLLLLTNEGYWGVPGGYMELNESVSDTAKRLLKGKTNLDLNKLDLFGIYSGPEKDFTLTNGDQVALLKVLFTCRDFNGTLFEGKENKMRFFPISSLPENLQPRQKYIFRDLLSNHKPVFID